jgi:nucleotide-binding universal stress UspA family protein
MKIKKILAPVDGSDYSLRAAAYAVEMAGVMDSEVILIHCHKSFPVVLGEPYFQNAINKIMKNANELLEPYRDIMNSAKVVYTERILEGPAAKAICHTAEVEGADLIIMGSRGLAARQLHSPGVEDRSVSGTGGTISWLPPPRD